MDIKKEAQNEREKLKKMSFRDKLWYIWEYYKFHLLAVVVVLFILNVVGTSLYRQSFTTRLSFAIVNDRSGGLANCESFETSLHDFLGYGKKDLIEINEGIFLTFDETKMTEYSYASMAKISALTAGGQLDVMIADEDTISHYTSLDAFLNIRDLIPEEFFEAHKDDFLYAKDGAGNLIPVGISLEDSSFSQDTGVVMDPPYFAVMGNSDHTEDILRTLQYLFRSRSTY